MHGKLRALKVEFEYDAEEEMYCHKHALDLTDHELTANEFAGQLEARASQVEAMLSRQMMNAGVAGIDPEFQVDVIDENTIGVKQTVTAKESSTSQDKFFLSAVGGETAQLISMLSIVDPEGAQDTMRTIDQIIQTMLSSEEAEE